MLSVGAVIALTAHSWSRERSGRAVAALLVGAGVGLVVGYFAGAYVACTWWRPTSNLCGLPAVFVSAPILAVAGAWIGWRTARRRI
jgi:MFS family permease